MDNRINVILEIEQMFRISYRMIRKELDEVWGETLTGAEFAVLNYLSQNSPQIVTALAQEFEVSVSHITHVVDQLEKKKFALRKRSHLDKRVVEIYITEEGISTAEWMAKQKNEYLIKKFSTFTTEELYTLLEFYKRMF